MPSALTTPPAGSYPGYPAAGHSAPASRLHAAPPDRYGDEPLRLDNVRSGEGARLLRIDATTLRIAPFRIDRWGQRYLSLGEIAIELATLASSVYRIVAVHDFRVEDRNPDLEECRAAVFLAREVEGRWEEAEDHPVECRTVVVLGRLDVAVRRITPP